MFVPNKRHSACRKGPREPPRPRDADLLAMPATAETSSPDTPYSMWTSRALVTLASGGGQNNNSNNKESPTRTMPHQVVAVDGDSSGESMVIGFPDELENSKMMNISTNILF